MDEEVSGGKDYIVGFVAICMAKEGDGALTLVGRGLSDPVPCPGDSPNFPVTSSLWIQWGGAVLGIGGWCWATTATLTLVGRCPGEPAPCPGDSLNSPVTCSLWM